jgi:hypothetical protein
VTGPEHYAEAERLLASARDLREPRPAAGWMENEISAIQRQAQVHATLALAMAMADVHPTSEWHKAASPPEVIP